MERRYNLEHDDARTAHLRETLCVGVVLFNVHNLTNLFLLPDILWLAVTLRLFVMTPIALLAVLYLDKLSSTHREWTILCLVIGAFAIGVILFALTEAPLGAYSFNEFGLTLVYSNMLLALRFRHAVIYTLFSTSIAVIAIWLKTSLDYSLCIAFTIQIAMAGVISLYANFKTERRRCLDYVVAHLAVERAALSDSAKQELHDQSRTDVLTGLPNRRLLDERLGEWFIEAQPVAVMMVDIDHFKLFNDALGHPAGDECLMQVGAVLDAFQTSDVFCARFGGEEFIVALRTTDALAVARLANALVRSIEALGIVHLGRSDGVGVVTASIGVAFRPTDGPATPHDVMAAADRALYAAKHKGRNCYVLDGTIDQADRSVA